MIVTEPNQDCMIFPLHFAECLSGDRELGAVIFNFAIHCSSKSFEEGKSKEEKHLCITSTAFILKGQPTIS